MLKEICSKKERQDSIHRFSLWLNFEEFSMPISTCKKILMFHLHQIRRLHISMCLEADKKIKCVGGLVSEGECFQAKCLVWVVQLTLYGRAELAGQQLQYWLIHYYRTVARFCNNNCLQIWWECWSWRVWPGPPLARSPPGECPELLRNWNVSLTVRRWEKRRSCFSC